MMLFSYILAEFRWSSSQEVENSTLDINATGNPKPCTALLLKLYFLLRNSILFSIKDLGTRFSSLAQNYLL